MRGCGQPWRTEGAAIPEGSSSPVEATAHPGPRGVRSYKSTWRLVPPSLSPEPRAGMPSGTSGSRTWLPTGRPSRPATVSSAAAGQGQAGPQPVQLTRLQPQVRPSWAEPVSTRRYLCTHGSLGMLVTPGHGGTPAGRHQVEGKPQQVPKPPLPPRFLGLRDDRT